MNLVYFLLAILSTSNLKVNENDDIQAFYPTSMLIDESSENHWCPHKIDRKEWTITADSELTTDKVNEGPISNILDGESSTIWISQINNQGSSGHDDRTNKNGPFKFVIDLNKRTTFKAFSFMPRQTGNEGKFRLYEFYAAHSIEELNTEMQNSKYVAKGQIDPKEIKSTLIILPYSMTAQYIAVRSLDQREAASCAEFNLYTDPDSTEPTPTPMAIYIDEFRDKLWNSFKIDRKGWNATANSEQPAGDKEGPASYMIDGNKTTLWHSNYGGGHDDRPLNTDPFQATFDLGAETTFKAFSYMPRQGGKNGQFRHYDFYSAQTREELDNNIKNEKYIAKGDIDPSSLLSTLVIFHSAYTARFVALRSLNHDGYATCAEFNLYSDSPTLPKLNTQLLVNELNDPGWAPYKIDRKGWNVTANSEHVVGDNNDGPASYMIDGNKDTLWHSNYGGGHDDRLKNTDPFQATFDLGQKTTFEAFSYMPRQGGEHGEFKHFEFYAAQTREELDTMINETKYLAKGDIDSTSKLSTFVVFEAKVTAQFIALLSLNHDGYASCAEFNLYSNIPNFYPEAPTPGPIPLSIQAIINEETDTFWSSLRIDRTGWKIRANSQEDNEHSNGDGPASFIINNNPNKWWHTRYENGHDDRQNDNDPYEVTINLGKMVTFSAFSYRPRKDSTGRFKHYQFYTANTTEELFIKIAEKNYINAGDIDSNLDSSTFIIFKEQQTAHHIALLSVNYDDGHATCAEFNIYTAPPSVPSDQSVMINQAGLINLTCDKFTYENWQSAGICVSSSQANLGSYSSVIGSKAKIKFFGIKVHLLVMKEENSGTGYIRIDDSIVAFVDFKSYTSGKAKSIIFSSNELEYGEHTLEIECLNAKFIVFSSVYVNPLPKANSYILGFSDFKQIEGEWSLDDSTPPVFSSTSDAASGTFEFYGNRFYLTGVRGSNVGNLNISIDDGDFISITERQTASIAQNNKAVQLYDSGVIDFKMHTVKITRSTTNISLINLFYTWYPNIETPAPTQTPIPDYDSIPVAEATGNYGSKDYLNKYKVQTNRFTYSSSGDQNGHPLSNAFDGSKGTFWASSIITDEKNKAIVNINFTNTECIEAIVIQPAYSTNNKVQPITRRYDGFPVIFKVYTSTNGEPFKLHTVFSGSPEPTDIWDLVQFVFRQPIYCDKLQLEFTNVTLDVSFGNNYTAACADFWFVAPIPPASMSSTPALTRTELPSHDSYEAGIIENIANGKDNNMEFNCPIQEGSIKIYTICSKCNKVSKDQKLWFSVYFQNGNIFDVIHEDLIINDATYMSTFVPRNKIIYHPDTNMLSYYIDSVNMKYVESELNLECFVPPKTPKATPSQTPSQSSTAELPPTIIVDEIIYDNDNFTDHVDNRTRIEKVVTKDDNENINVVVKKSEFNDITNDDGGAIHLINCGIKTNGNIFNGCKSNVGGGGAIFIENSKLFKNDVIFYRLKFTSCEAEYGGGAYIYSDSLTNNVDIKYCIFKQNVATRSQSNDGKFGGAAMFLSVTRCQAKMCKFEDNDVKVYSELESPSSLRILQLEEQSLIFSECKFKINENMKFSLFYFGGNYANDLKLQSCTFYGKLKDGAYFIDDHLTTRNQPKMIVNSCRFSSKPSAAFNPNSQFVLIDLKDQIFESEYSSNENEKNMKSHFIFSALVMAVIIALIVIKKFISQKDYSNDNKELEISSQLNDDFLI